MAINSWICILAVPILAVQQLPQKLSPSSRESNFSQHTLNSSETFAKSSSKINVVNSSVIIDLELYETAPFSLYKDISQADWKFPPGESFYHFANGAWLNASKIPEDKSTWSGNDILTELSSENLREIFENLPKTSIVAQLYRSGMNTQKIEEDGLHPVTDLLELVSKIQTKADFWYVFGKLQKEQHATPFFRLSAGPSARNASWAVLHIEPGGLGLSGDDVDPNPYVGFELELGNPPDRYASERGQIMNSNIQLGLAPKAEQGINGMGPGAHEQHYRSNQQKINNGRTKLIQQYAQYITNLFEFSGTELNDASYQARNIINFESLLSGINQNQNYRQESAPIKTWFSQLEIQQTAPNVDFNAIFMTIGIKNPTDIVLRRPQYLQKLSEILGSTDMNTLKSYLKFQVLFNAAPHINEVFRNEHFKFYYKSRKRIESEAPRWTKVVRKVSKVLEDPVSELYVEKYFSPEAKKSALEMVSYIISSFKEAIEHAEWLLPSTKRNAIYKLSKLNVKIGHPDKFDDYSPLQSQISEDNPYLSNIRAAKEYNFKLNTINKINQPVDRNKWTAMSPFEVNAYYNFKMNEIVFPAAKLQPPFFFPPSNEKPLGEPAMNFGSIGSVIGHEISHGYDNSGRHYDGNGELSDWWTPQDAHIFNAKSHMLINQFNNHKISVGNVNGKLTLGENIADLGGVSISYAAFQKYMHDHPEYQSIPNGFTPNQRFFLAYAQNRAQLIREAESKSRINSDPHSPAVWRVNGILNNIPAFYEAFEIKRGDNMYLEENQRVQIWSLKTQAYTPPVSTENVELNPSKTKEDTEKSPTIQENNHPKTTVIKDIMTHGPKVRQRPASKGQSNNFYTGIKNAILFACILLYV